MKPATPASGGWRAFSVWARQHAYDMGVSLETRGDRSEEGNVNGLKQYVGRKVLVSTADGGAIQGTLWKVRRSGIEIREAREPVRGTDLAGILWLPAGSVFQVQISGGDN